MRATEKTSKTVRLTYGSMFGVYTVLTGALIIWQALDIYYRGSLNADGIIFTRQNVLESISRLSPALWIWVSLAVVGFVLWEVFSVKEKLPKLDVRYTLHILKNQVPRSLTVSKDKSLKESYKFISAEEERLEALWTCCICVGLAGVIYSIAYLANPSNFPKADVTREMLNMVQNVMPWVAATLALACGICVYEGQSAKKQLVHVKKLISASKKQELDCDGDSAKFVTYKDAVHRFFARIHKNLQKKAQTNKFCAFLLIVYKRRVMVARITACTLAAIFIIVGIVNGSARDLLLKAINICTECIGLG